GWWWMRLQLRRRRADLLFGIAVAVVLSCIVKTQRTADASPATDRERASERSSSKLIETASSDIAAYADSDHTFVLTPSGAGSVSDPTGRWSIHGDYLVDMVSAASVDIVSTASRSWSEVRHEGSLSGTYQPGAVGVATSASFSSEPDYLSLNAGGSVFQDLF